MIIYALFAELDNEYKLKKYERKCHTLTQNNEEQRGFQGKYS